ncbi:dipeptidase [Roseivirga pacifica]|uniref:dipeptidase n=1 Tax=Roseivirga pacifica TaxID=1267423 RepID=UPI00227D3FF5|nr:dipeptidase [Roseivirga pacifica]
MKRIFYAAATLAFLWSCDSTKKEEKTVDVSTMSEAELTEYAKGIHDRVITLDTHDDINTSNFTTEKNYTERLSTQVNLPKMEEGGLDVAWFVVYTGQGELTEEGYAKAYENADDKFKAIHRLCEEIAPNDIELAYTSDDVRRIVAAGKKVAMIGVENGYPIGTNIDRVKEFYDRGARYMSLAHNGHSQLSDSNTGERDTVWLHNGLSDLGKEVIAEMNKWGIMIDLSHPSKEANMQMMRLSKAPVIASHSSARTMNDHSRNLDDEQLMMLKENGGVVQTVAFKSYVNGEKNSANSAKRREVEGRIAEEVGFELKERSDIRNMNAEEREAYFAAYSGFQEGQAERIALEVNEVAPAVNVFDFVDHVDYLVNKIGLKHVGISSDFDGGGGVEGWADASETFNVTLELVKRGYTEEEIGMLWSGNLLRVLDETQAVAEKIQAGEL